MKHVQYPEAGVLQDDEVLSRRRGIFKDFVKFAGKHLCWNLFFTIVRLLTKPAVLLEKRFQNRCYLVN